MDFTIDNQLSLQEIALSLPDGLPQQWGFGFTSAYLNAYRNVNHDPLIGKADKKFELGHRRRSYGFESLRQACDRYGEESGVTFVDVRMGKKKGMDSHLEIYAGRLRITSHHLGRTKKLPDLSKYLQQGLALNDLLSQAELFDPSIFGKQSKEKGFNLLILHRENPSSPDSVESINFVFARDKKIIASFSLKDVVQEQNRLSELADKDFQYLKLLHQEMVRRYNA